MGKPGARLTDMTAHGGTIMGPGVPTVMTGKMPAATILDQHVCPMVTGVVPHVGGPATLASTGVFIGKKPAARMGDLHVCVGPPSMPVMGCFTVLIGEVGGGGGGGAGSAASAAAANTKSPASVEPFPLAEPPTSTELHYCQFKFVDSAGKGLGGIPYVFTGPDKSERTGCSAPEGEAYYSGLPKGGSFKVKAGAVAEAKWSKAKAALDDEIEMTAKADGLADGTPAIITVLERSNTGLQRFLHTADCKVEGKKIKAKWKVDLGSDDTPSPKDNPQRAEYTYLFIAYAAGGVAVSDKLLIESDLEIEVLDEIAQPITDKPVEVLLTNGEVKTGKLDAKGKFKVGKVPAKSASVSLKVPGVYQGSLTGFKFDPGKCFLLPGAGTDLRPVVKLYYDHPDFNLLIVGHTDRAGDSKSNLELSKARAESVAAFLKNNIQQWLDWYGTKKPERVRWGIQEDKHMLSAIRNGTTPFLTGPVNGRQDRKYLDAVKDFQIWCKGNGIKVPTNGVMDDSTRKILIEKYMALDGIKLPADLAISTHGCGESHNRKPTLNGVAEPSNRRVEIFLFEGNITPPPVANCPAGGCKEWEKWINATTNTMDLSVGVHKGFHRDEFSQSIVDCFHLLDKDKDGTVSISEIKAAFGNKEFKRQYAAMVSTLMALSIETTDYFRLFCNLDVTHYMKPDDGFCLIDVDNYDRLRAADPNDDLVQMVDYLYPKAKAKIDNPDRSPFNGPLKPFKMKQGIVGDCWFLSAIVGLAASRPQEIQAMIKPLGAGKFEIKLPGVPKAIIIEAPTDAEIGAFSTTDDNGIWPVLLEKAFGTLEHTYKPNKVSAMDAADDGDWPSRGIKLLTNHDADEEELWANLSGSWKEDVKAYLSPAKMYALRGKLESAFENGKIVAADIMDLGKPDESDTPDGLPKIHAYTILSYDPEKVSVRIRNPWGNISFRGKSGEQGIIEVSLKDFDRNFTHLYFEK